MKKVVTSTIVLLAGSVVTAIAFGQPARANQSTFWFNGLGISGSATVTIVPNVSPSDPNLLCGTAGQNACRADPPGAFMITGITGTFSDANIGISNAQIQALVPISPANERDPVFDPAVPTSLSFIDYTNEIPPNDVGFSYDNLFYSGGAPIVCAFPFTGTFVDPFGVAFTIAGGDTVVFWGDGNSGPGGSLTYGAAVTDGVDKLDYQFAGINAAIPEPSTWAMLLVGFAGVGFAGYRRSPKGSAAIVAA